MDQFSDVYDSISYISSDQDQLMILVKASVAENLDQFSDVYDSISYISSDQDQLMILVKASVAETVTCWISLVMFMIASVT